MSDLDTELHLHARIFRTGTNWYADLDDELNPQPDAPYWHGSYTTQRAAIDAACARLAAYHLTHRLSHHQLPKATTSA